VVKAPPNPFAPLVVDWDVPLYRVHSNRRQPGEFNPGIGSATRWAFFGEPVVPVLYAAETQEAAVAESILHDVPLVGGRVSPESYLDRVMSRLTPTRPLRLAQFAAGGLRRLGVRARDLTDTDADTYVDTVRWAQAVWQHTDCDGITWMSRHWNTSPAIVLLGDRVRARDLSTDPDFARAFLNIPDIEWLAAICERAGVLLIPPT
jgi:hypothetical protein